MANTETFADQLGRLQIQHWSVAHASEREKELLMLVVSLASQAIESGADLDIMPPVDWKELYGEWATSIRTGMQTY